MAKEITGYQLREALKRWRIRRDVADKQFSDSLWGFEKDEKPSPNEIAGAFAQADQIIAQLQDLQQEFNRNTFVEVAGKKITLSLAIKLVGGAGRLESMWRKAATDTGTGDARYYGVPQSRKADEEYRSRRIPQKDAIELSDNAAAYASALRAAIAGANAHKIVLPADFPPVFE